MQHLAQLIGAVEGFLEELRDIQADGSENAAAVQNGNRTPPVTDYEGGDVEQDMADCLRRAIRKSREGQNLSKKERNVMRRVLKEFKEDRDILNTNGRDVFTHNGL